MIDYFDKKDCDYYCLLRSDQTNLEDFISGVRTETKTSNTVPNFLQHCTTSQQQEMFKYCFEHREEFEITTDHHLLIAVVWVLPQEKRLFNLYPEVLFIDITSDTNKEKRPLFTITETTATGRMFTLKKYGYLTGYFR